MPGTGVRGAVYVFLPVRKQLWGDSEFNDGWASPALLTAVRTARKAGVVTRLYNPSPGGDAEGGQVLVQRSPRAGAGADPALEALLAQAPAHWTVEESGAPLMAICTHGTRDRCCAKWGFAVYREAARLHGAGLSPFRPIECSHLGGDRFAATGIVFPSGSMYGHLDRADLLALAAAETAGEIVVAHYRGRVFESEMTQIVRAGLARDGHAVRAASALKLLNPDAAPGEVEVSAEDGARRFAVMIGTAQTAFYGSCTALAEERPSKVRRLVYQGARLL
jgi:hypothetical protein